MEDESSATEGRFYEPSGGRYAMADGFSGSSDDWMPTAAGVYDREDRSSSR